MGFLTGGTKSSSSSSNQAYPWLKDQYAGTVGQGIDASELFGALLGLGGDEEAAQAGFDRFRDSTGFDFMLDSGSRAITGSAAARGLLNSGSTLKALTGFGQKLGSQYFQNYLANVDKLAQRGLDAGQLIGGAGQQSQSTSKQTGGLFDAIGSLGQGIGGFAKLSDRRLKTDIEKLGELPDGLGVYRWSYIWDRARQHVGVMADEVAKLRPWALGPRVFGFATVNYGEL